MSNDLTLYKEKNTTHLIEISSKDELPSEIKADGVLIKTNGNEKETRRIIDKLKGKPFKIALQAHDNVFNRRALETMKINYLVSPEKEIKKDNLKQRDSGLNHILAKIAKKNNIAIIINHNELTTLPPKEKATQLSRIIQNISICRKANCEIKIASLGENKDQLITPKDRQTLFSTLKATSKQTKISTKF
jgi:ribonuclease P/MRP protein subunit RPP1